MIRRTYSKKLIQDWKKALQATFGFNEYMDLLIQPTFTQKYLTYLPMLNYTDRTTQEIDDLLELAKENPYSIRTLNFEYSDFRDYDTVTLRIDTANKTIDEVMKGYKRLARRNIRHKNEYEQYTIEIHPKEQNEKSIALFYKILKDIYKRHGTPLFPKKFLYHLNESLEDLEFVFMYENKEPVGGLMIFYDNGIATFHYGGILTHKKDKVNGYALYHSVIKHICENKNMEIIDFGRSPYNIGTYFFKTRFGAYPVKIDLHTHEQKNIYSKYKLASEIWKKLPSPVTDFLGPKLTKYLVDL